MDALLRRRLMMLGGGGPTPPPTPVPVFYDHLVFDGKAYIDTNIVPADNSSFTVQTGYETQKTAQRLFLMGDSNTGYTGINLGGATSSSQRQMLPYYNSSTQLATNRYLDFSYTSYNLFLTPKRVGWGNTAYTFTKGNHYPASVLVLGSVAGHSGQPFTGRMGTFCIYGSDAQNVTTYDGFSSYTPTYTLRPCTYNGEAGMWCVETSTFYGNTAGEGTLSVANI